MTLYAVYLTSCSHHACSTMAPPALQQGGCGVLLQVSYCVWSEAHGRARCGAR
jgi:hypothetical protein